jgi:hypothetical protein
MVDPGVSPNEAQSHSKNVKEPDIARGLDNSPDPSDIPGPSNLDKGSPSRSTAEDHYFHAQQAVLLASQGGLRGVIKQTSVNAPDAIAGEVDPKIGRSLFISLNLTTWEADESVVMEIGWAAVWWQAKLEGADNQEGEEFEEIRQHGHFV